MNIKTIGTGFLHYDDLGVEILPKNFVTKLLWKFLKISIEYFIKPPHHINCRCQSVVLMEE